MATMSGTGRITADGVDLGSMKYTVNVAEHGTRHVGVLHHSTVAGAGTAWTARRVTLAVQSGKEYAIIVRDFQPGGDSAFELNANLP